MGTTVVRIGLNLLVCPRCYKLLTSMKRVTVMMSEECHKVLKMYAAFKGMTVSEASYEMMRAHIHKEASVNEHVKTMLNLNGIELDPPVE